MPKRYARRAPSWAVPAGIAVVAAILVTLVITQIPSGNQAGPESSQQSSPGESQQQPSLKDVERRDPDDPLAAGPVDAPVGLVVFSDYQCPYCAEWNHETLPEMMKYVGSGELRIEWRDVHVFGAASERAARAAYAAGAQDSYRKYHDALFPDGEPLPESKLTDEAFIDLAKQLGLDSERFTEDYDSKRTNRETSRNAEEALSLGVTSTPMFILDSQPIVGAQPTDEFVDRLDAALR